MPRATAANMLILFGGTYPPGHNVTSFGNFAVQTDALMDTLALPGTLSTTGTNEVALANRLACRLVIRSMWMAAGGPLSGQPEPALLTPDIKTSLEELLASTDVEWSTIDTIDESA